MNIVIVGNGLWGKAIFHIISQNTPHVTVAKRGEKIKNADVIVICVPTQAINEVLPLLPKNLKAIVNTAKGIDHTTHTFPYQIIQNALKKRTLYYTLIGPSYSKDVMLDMPTVVNIGHAQEAPFNKTVQELFQTSYFKVKLTKSVEVLEISAAFKNIYAIACGFSDSLEYGINTKVRLILEALEEMKKLFKGLNVTNDGNTTAGTIGDLLLTCTNTESRNFRFGELLNKHTGQEAQALIASTVEGYNSLNSLSFFEKKAKVKLPLANFIHDLTKSDDKHYLKNRFEILISKLDS